MITMDFNRQFDHSSPVCHILQNVFVFYDSQQNVLSSLAIGFESYLTVFSKRCNILMVFILRYICCWLAGHNLISLHNGRTSLWPENSSAKRRKDGCYTSN